MRKRLSIVIFIIALVFAYNMGEPGKGYAVKKSADNGIEKEVKKTTQKYEKAPSSGKKKDQAATEFSQEQDSVSPDSANAATPSENTGEFAETSSGEAEAVADDPESHSLWEIFQQGGPFMWPILILAAVGMAFIIERFIFFAKAKLASKEYIDKLEKCILSENLESVEKLCVNENNKISQIIKKGLELKTLGYERVEKALSVAGSVEIASLERGLNVLSAIGNIVPMLGFLGTVTGMITAFNDIAAADQVSAKIVAGGIKEALLTTASGLLIAIPTLLFYNYFIHKIEGFISTVERLSSDIVEKLIKGKDV